VHAREIRAHEIHAYKVYTHEIYASEVHAYKVHAREIHAYYVQAAFQWRFVGSYTTANINPLKKDSARQKPAKEA
jgi:hypothetical protein